MASNRRYRSAPPKPGTTRVNKYPGTCHWCKAPLAAEAGVVVYTEGTWQAQHRPLHHPTGPWDRYSDGCPGEAERATTALNEAPWHTVTNAEITAQDDNDWAQMGAYVEAQEEAMYG